jgi:hypothetical protein
MTFRPYRNAVSIRGPDTVAGVAFRREPNGVSWIEAGHRRAIEVAGIAVDDPEVLLAWDIEGRWFLFVLLTLDEWNSRIREHAINQDKATSLDKLLDALDQEW